MMMIITVIEMVVVYSGHGVNILTTTTTLCIHYLAHVTRNYKRSMYRQITAYLSTQYYQNHTINSS